jgi:hypothetical protein
MKLIYSFALMAVGSLLMYWLKRRRFKRVNQYGFEEFKSFKEKTFAGTIEKPLWWVAVICLGAGAILAI